MYPGTATLQQGLRIKLRRQTRTSSCEKVKGKSSEKASLKLAVRFSSHA